MPAESLTPDLETALAEFTQWIDNRINTPRWQHREGALLFHYTDMTGFRGILETEELWLTGIQHLNDPSEIRHGLKLAIDELTSQPQDQHAAIHVMCKILKDVLQYRIADFADFFVASLSEDGDELGQWRAYGDNGMGFSIGLDPKIFMSGTHSQSIPTERSQLESVEYDPIVASTRQKEVAAKGIEVFQRCIDRQLINTDNLAMEFSRVLSAQMSLDILWNSITTKHRAYRLEREVRLILAKAAASPVPQVDIRSRGARSMVPFVRLKLPIRQAGHVRKIVIGPAAPAETVNAVRHYLRAQGIDPADGVVQSEIPYRCHR